MSSIVKTDCGPPLGELGIAGATDDAANCAGTDLLAEQALVLTLSGLPQSSSSKVCGVNQLSSP